MNVKLVKRSLGAEIREWRRRRKISQEKLAPAAGMHVNQLGRIERGEANPTLEKLFGIAASLNVSLGQLFVGAEKR